MKFKDENIIENSPDFTILKIEVQYLVITLKTTVTASSARIVAEFMQLSCSRHIN